MVTEMSQAETGRMTQDRKRQVPEYEAPKMATAGTQTEEEVKRPRVDAPPAAPAPAKPTNNGWGELFKDRDTFVEMHIC